MRMTFLLLPFIAALLSGCGLSWLVDPATNPVIQDNIGEVGTLATTAERRIVLVSIGGVSKGKFCA